MKDTKNGKPRTISLVGEPLQILKAHFLKQRSHTHYLFPAKKRFGKISIRKAWDEALKRASIKGLRFHDLRHTFATYAAEAGASNLELATAMGHQTLQMLQRYTHMNAKITQRLSAAVHQRIVEGTMAKTKHQKLADAMKLMLNAIEDHEAKVAKQLACVQLHFYERYAVLGRRSWGKAI